MITVTLLFSVNKNDSKKDFTVFLDLPASREKIRELFEETGIGTGEGSVCIDDVDYEYAYLTPEMFKGLDEINELAERLAQLSPKEEKYLQAIIEDGQSIYDALDMLTDIVEFPDCDSITQAVREYAEQSGIFEDVPETFRHYFDYEAFGRDLQSEALSFLKVDDGYIAVCG